MTTFVLRRSDRISRDQALTCSLPEQVEAWICLPGGVAHRLLLRRDPAQALTAQVLDAAQEYLLVRQSPQAPSTATLLRQLEPEVSPEEQAAAASARPPKQRRLGLRLVDHDTGEPLSGVELVALSGSGVKLRASTDVRGRATFEGLGAGSAVLQPAASKVPPRRPAAEQPTIKSLLLTCGHQRSSAERLQVVASRTGSASFTRKGFGHELEIKQESGRHEQITATVKTTGGAGQVRLGDGAWQGSPSKHKLPAPADRRLWLKQARPTIHQVTGRGPDGATRSATVEQFPSERYSGTFTVDPGYDLLEKLLEALDTLLEILCSTTPATIDKTFEGPKGSVSLQWGWEEDRDWRSYFLFSGKFGLDPLYKAGIEVEVSLLAALGMAVGIPPGLSKIIGKHLADVLIKLGAESTGSFTGSLEAKSYPGGPTRAQNTTELVLVRGHLKLEFAVRVGSDYLLSLQLLGGGRVGLEGKASLEIQDQGIFFTPSARVLPAEVYVTVKTRAFYFFGSEKTEMWPLWDGLEFYKPGPYKLWPSSSGGSG